MKEVRSAWRTWGRICFAISAVFLILYAILGAVLGFLSGILALGLNGAVWIALGSGFYLYSKSCQCKLERLKYEGLCYDAEVLHVAQNLVLMRIGSYISAYADCRYIDSEGKVCLVRSASFLAGGNFIGMRSSALDGLQSMIWDAKVYVSKTDPRDYYVAVYESDGTIGIKVDHDYR